MKRFACCLVLVLSFGLSPLDAGATGNNSEEPGGGDVEGVAPEAVEGEVVTPSDRAYGAFQRGMYLTAFQLALPEAQNGDAAAQTLIAEIYERGLGVARNPETAAEWYEIAANSGNREAQFALSVKLMQGSGIKKDISRGIEMMKKAADAGHPLALFNYANHLIDQRPTSATYRKVLPLYEKAAEFQLADAYYALAKIHQEGLATGINDHETGLKWLRRAANAGIDTAQLDLALYLLRGKPDDNQKREAITWLGVAAKNGNVIAQNRLAHFYFSDFGTMNSRLEGAIWYIISRRAGRSDLQLDLRFQSMDEAERAEALKRADNLPTNIINSTAQLQRF